MKKFAKCDEIFFAAECRGCFKSSFDKAPFKIFTAIWARPDRRVLDAKITDNTQKVVRLIE